MDNDQKNIARSLDQLLGINDANNLNEPPVEPDSGFTGPYMNEADTQLALNGIDSKDSQMDSE